VEELCVREVAGSTVAVAAGESETEEPEGLGKTPLPTYPQLLARTPITRKPASLLVTAAGL
jgi:hypothetical protein